MIYKQSSLVQLKLKSSGIHCQCAKAEFKHLRDMLTEDHPKEVSLFYIKGCFLYGMVRSQLETELGN